LLESNFFGLFLWFQQNCFDGLAKLFLNLYPTKF